MRRPPLSRRSVEDQLDAEVRFHLDQRVDELVAQGLSREAARAQARREFGGVEQVKEACRDERASRWANDTWRDARVAVRSLVRAPVFSVVAVLVLTLGLGANIAMFQVLDALVLRTLPVPAADQLWRISVNHRGNGRSGNFSGPLPDLSAALVDGLERELRGTADLAVWSYRQANLADGGTARLATVLGVNGDYFRVLGVTPRLGRLLGRADDQPGCGTGAAVVGERFWQRTLGGRPDVLGQTLRLDGHTFEIVGITPARFFGVEVGRHPDVYIPLCTERAMATGPSRFDSSREWWLSAVARVPAATSEAQLSARLDALAPTLFRETLPREYRPEQAEQYLGFGLDVRQAGQGISPLRTQFAPPLYLLFVITAIVLLIACANLANLLLARASHREREIAVRLAIGASRARLVRYVAAEAGILTIAAAMLGVLVAFAFSRTLVGALGSTVSLDITMNWPLVAFSVGLALVTMILCSVGPALRAAAVPPAHALRHSLRTSTAGSTLSWRRMLIVSEVALTFMLLIGALLFARSLGNLRAVDVGFDAEGLLVSHVDLEPLPDWPDRRPAIAQAIEQRLDALPWVTSFAEIRMEPLGPSSWNDTIAVSGLDRTDITSQLNRVGPAFFETMGMSIVQGRGVAVNDGPNAPAVAVVDQTFVDRYLDGAPVIGRTVRFLNGGPDRTYEVVGVVSRSKYRNLKAADEPVIYVAAAQADVPSPTLSLIVRSQLSPEATTAAMARLIGDVSPVLSLQTTSLATNIDNALRIERLLAALSAAFGVLALLLAGVGLYGVIAYFVARREHEIGIRLALGASRGHVIGRVVRDTAWLVAGGIALGFGGALVGMRLIEGLLFGLESRDPASYAAALAVLVSVGLAASLLPAWRAARTSPMKALRQD